MAWAWAWAWSARGWPSSRTNSPPSPSAWTPRGTAPGCTSRTTRPARPLLSAIELASLCLASSRGPAGLAARRPVPGRARMSPAPAIIGLGMTPMSVTAGTDSFTLAVEAVGAALAGAGLERADADGLLVGSSQVIRPARLGVALARRADQLRRGGGHGVRPQRRHRRCARARAGQRGARLGADVRVARGPVPEPVRRHRRRPVRGGD